MTEKPKRHPRRSDQEWIQLIQECRTSGLTDKEWCEQHKIQPSKFYYHIRRLRAKACSLPDNPRAAIHETHEIVNVASLCLSATPAENTGELHSHTVVQNTNLTTSPAIRLSYGGYCIEILNSAEHRTIISTLAALQQLC